MKPKWLEVARSYVGTREGAGKLDNPVVLALYAKAGHPEIRHDEVPWCAAFVGACLHDAGLPSTGTLWALDYARYGKRLLSPIVGAIATKKRNGGGHVFFICDFDPNYVYGLGGNQSDAVSIVRYRRSIVYSYSWPADVPTPKNPREGAFRGKMARAGSEA